jgi:hypothetical protein
VVLARQIRSADPQVVGDRWIVGGQLACHDTAVAGLERRGEYGIGRADGAVDLPPQPSLLNTTDDDHQQHQQVAGDDVRVGRPDISATDVTAPAA